MGFNLDPPIPPIPDRARIPRALLWIAIAFALRTIALAGDGLWMDEGYTAWTSHLSAREHEAALRYDDAPPLYYFIQRGLIPRLPPNEASVRALSVAAGVAGTAWLLIAPPIPALGAIPAAFYAAGTYGVYYGRLGRSYALLILWCLMLLTAVARFRESGKLRWLGLVILSEALALWTHNVAIHIVVGANLAWLLCGRRSPVRWIAGQALVLALWLPYLLTLFPAQYASHTHFNLYIERYWREIPIGAAPLISLASFTSGARIRPLVPAQRWSYVGPGSVLLSIAALAAVTVLLAAAFTNRRRRQDAVLAASLTLGPLLSMVVASVIAPPSYLPARTDAIAYAGCVVWASLGIRALPRRIAWPILGVLALSTALATATRLPIDGQKRENDRRIGEALRAKVRPGDWVAFVMASRPSIDYYLSEGRPGRPDPRIRRVSFPGMVRMNAAAEYPAYPESVQAWEREAQRIRRAFETDSGGPPDRSFYWVGPMYVGRERSPTAQDLPYPGNILAYEINGLRPLRPLIRLHGDEVDADWLVFRRVPASLVSGDSLEPVRLEP